MMLFLIPVIIFIVGLAFMAAPAWTILVALIALAMYAVKGRPCGYDNERRSAGWDTFYHESTDRVHPHT